MTLTVVQAERQVSSQTLPCALSPPALSLSRGFSFLPIRLRWEKVGGEEMERRNVSKTLNRVRLCVLS